MTGPKKSRSRGTLYLAAAWALGGVSAIVLFVLFQDAKGLEALLVPVLVGLIGAAVFGLYWRGQQHLSDDADTAMAQDPRPPVVYLRSFEDDTANAIEWSLKDIMEEEVGPFVAVGRPGDTLPPFGVASRAYLPDDEWQPYVRGLLDRAALVILRAGRTAGLQWELAQCFRHIPPQHLIILVPGDDSVSSAFADITGKSGVGVSFPVVPEKARRRHQAQDICGLVFFDAGWRGIFVPFQSAAWKGQHHHRDQLNACPGAAAGRAGAAFRAHGAHDPSTEDERGGDRGVVLAWRSPWWGAASSHGSRPRAF